MSKRPSATSQRPTKAERKEQARRERAELQRKMAKAKRNRRIAIVVASVLAVAVGAYAVSQSLEAEDPATTTDPAALLQQAAQASTAAGCDDPTNVGPYEPDTQDQAHVATEEAPPLSRYPSQPPASGPHNPTPLPAGVYDTPPPVDQAIHSLEHGGVIVWYAPDAPAAQVDRLTSFYGDDIEAGSRVIVAPYDYPDQGPAGQFPAGTQMAMVAWHFVETCAQVSLPAAFEFSSRYAFPPFGQQDYVGEAPERGGVM
jgi:hypothetical protein